MGCEEGFRVLNAGEVDWEESQRGVLPFFRSILCVRNALSEMLFRDLTTRVHGLRKKRFQIVHLREVRERHGASAFVQLERGGRRLVAVHKRVEDGRETADAFIAQMRGLILGAEADETRDSLKGKDNVVLEVSK